MSERSTHRVIALVGPQSSGKTTLLEAILKQTGKLGGKSSQNGSARVFGDSSPEAKAHDMGTDINFADFEFMGDSYSVIDCPGAIELQQDAMAALAGVDAAIVVTDTDTDKLFALSPLLKRLEEINCPRYIFLNKIDRETGSIDALTESLATVVEHPVVLRHIPLHKDGHISGYADLASERAYIYEDGAPSHVIESSGDEEDIVKQARYTMLETLADFDDHMMEELLEDIVPPKDEIYADLKKDIQEGLIIPVLLGSALHQNGVHRLLKTLRHECPTVDLLSTRLTDRDDATIGVALKTLHTGYGGKLTVTRLLKGNLKDNDSLCGSRFSTILSLHGDGTEKKTSASAGDLVALGKLEDVNTGDLLVSDSKEIVKNRFDHILSPVYTRALKVSDRKDEVKLATSLAKICEEDPSLRHEQSAETHQTLLGGQGNIHLLIALERLKSRFDLAVETIMPRVPYRETIRGMKKQHSRHKKQSGGHGQFGDVVIEVSPLPAGKGFEFTETIHGGSIPKQYIPSVEAGVKEYLQKGPLGFPVVDVAVKLTDGSYHAVDSSDMAFKTAGRLAMSEAMPDCKPVLLEPIMQVQIMVPSDFTAKVNSLISGRRGQILGFDAREGWPGWDQVDAYLPQSEMDDMIIELRSMTYGAGRYEYKFDHLNEITGKIANDVLTQQAAE